MHKPFGGIEAYDGAPRAAALNANHAPRQIENDEHHECAENGDGADPTQRYFMEMSPVAPCRLLDRVGFRVRNAATALDRLELLQQQLLVDRARRRVN